jgi:hypothetical protein
MRLGPVSGWASKRQNAMTMGAREHTRLGDNDGIHMILHAVHSWQGHKLKQSSAGRFDLWDSHSTPIRPSPSDASLLLNGSKAMPQ